MSAPDWIPVGQRHPEDGQRVLVVFSPLEEDRPRQRECRIAAFHAPSEAGAADLDPHWWFVEGSHWHALNCVTHWAPLPDLPDEERH